MHLRPEKLIFVLMKEDHFFFINEIRVYPDLHLLEREDQKINIEPKVMQVLLYLVDKQERIVSKEEIIKEVWKDVIVVDKVLTRAISQLRKHLNDQAETPRYIETIPRKGYRLIAEVKEASSSPGLIIRSLFITGNNRILPLITILALSSFAITYRLNQKEVSPHPPAVQSMPLTSFHSWEYDPAISPDGNYLAFVWNGVNTPGWNIKNNNTKSWDIYIKSLKTDTIFPFSTLEGSEGSPVWSADGQYLVYYQRISFDSCRLLMKALQGDRKTRVLGSIKSRYPDLAWSPDGKFLAFNEQPAEGATYHLSLLSLITLKKQQLSFPPASVWGDHQPSFSPDGKQLAFTRAFSEGVQEMFLFDFKNEKLHPLTHLGGNIHGHQWTADGRSIVFSYNPNGHSELRQLRLDDGFILPFLPGIEAANPQLHGPNIVFEHWESQTNVWELHLPSGSVRPYIASTFWDLHPSFSPDGKNIAFASNRSGHYEIWLKNTEDGQEKQLTHFNSGFTSTPRWSPDGRQLAFEIRKNGQTDLYLHILESGQNKSFANTACDELTPFFSADGQWLYYTSSQNDQWNVWRKSLTSDSVEQVTHEGGYGAQASSNGKMVFYTKHGREGLWSFDMKDRQEKVILPFLSHVDWGNWILTSDGIFAIRRAESPNPDRLVFFDFQEKSSTPIFTFPDRVPDQEAALALSPDGQYLLFGQLNHAACDIKWISTQ